MADTEKKVPTGIHLRPSTLETLRDLAVRDGDSMNEIVEGLLLGHFKKVGPIPSRGKAKPKTGPRIK